MNFHASLAKAAPLGSKNIHLGKFYKMPRRRQPTDSIYNLKIFLLKDGFGDPESIFKTPRSLHHKNIEGVGTLFYSVSHTSSPGWLSLFSSRLQGDELRKLFNASTRAVLLIKQGGRSFALTFGYGRYLIKEGVCESRFGLKVILNTVNHESLRSIDKVSIGSVPMHSRDQLSRSGAPRDFGLNFDEDLIQAVTGTPKTGYTMLGETVSGSDVLSISIPCTLESIKPLLAECLTKSASTDYRENFSWVDQVNEIDDKMQKEELDEVLIQKMRGGETDNIWLAVPEIIEWADVSGFKYSRRDNALIFHDLSLAEFFNTVSDPASISTDLLKQRQITCLRTSNEAASLEWSAFQCLYAEIDHGGNKFILTNKGWYKVDQDFVKKIDEAYHAVPTSAIDFPDYIVDRFAGRGENKGERGYNRHFCDQDRVNRVLLDGELIRYGGGYSSFEFCDIYTKSKKIVHVKRYGGSSSLSHLFQQGYASGELFKQEEFRRKVNGLLPDGFKLAEVGRELAQGEYEVIFVVINNSARELDLPFFSKVTLRSAVQRLRGLGYQVALNRVRSAKIMGA
ncbi:MAG: TIGR04141 family sporadically distributed protein [bacterium]|nr:TIGR04141 family sporadically distributed protein [bacterium]